MATAVIVDAVRTPLGRRNGGLKDVHPVDLAAHVLRAIVERNDVDPALVEDVIMGCVMQVGEQGINVARNAALAAGLPRVGRRHDGRPPVRFVAAGRALRRAGRDRRRVRRRDRGRRREHDARADGRVDRRRQVRLPVRPEMTARYPNLVPQGISAELIAEKWGISREENDAFSVESHKRAARAREEGRFDREIVPITRHR